MSRLDKLNTLFSQVSESLNTNSLNYCVNIGLYPCVGTANKEITEIVKSALGERALLGGYSKVDSNEILDAVIEGLKYEGDDSSHPNLTYLRSDSGQQAIQDVAFALNELLNESKSTFSFWLKEGHPFYPVFWDYAHVIEVASGTFVLIGCCSD